MSKTKVLQTNFTAGELSPVMLGRVDTTKYASGALQLSNFVVKPQGGAFFRQGTKFLGVVKDSSKKTIIHEFEFSDLQTYQLELGNNYFRIWYNGGFIETSPGSGTPLEVTTPYAETDLVSLKFAQSADVLYVTHPSYMPQKIERLGANSWTITPIEPLDGPYLSGTYPVTADITLTNYTSSAVATASSAVFTTGSTLPISAVVVYLVSSHYRVKITTTSAHGLTTGNSVAVVGLLVQNGPGAPYDATYPRGNGTYTVTVLSTTDFYLNESTAPSGALFTFASALLTLAPTLRYFEYRQNNAWGLCSIINVVSTTVANVNVIQNLCRDITKLGSKVYVNGTDASYVKLTADNSGVFTSDDVGSYIRACTASTGSTTFNWYQILSYIDSSNIRVSAALSMVAISYPTTIVTITEPVVGATLTASVDLFVSTDVGRLVRLNFGGKQPWFKIIVVYSSTVVDVEVNGVIPVDSTNVSIFYNNGITSLWKLGSWSDTTGYPLAVCFHEQRLGFGGSNTEPQGLWLSQTSDYENFAPSDYDSVVTDNCAISYSFASNKANPIRWLESDTVLLVGTLGTEYIVKAPSTGPLTPTNIVIAPQSRQGALANCKALSVGNTLLFVQRAGNKLMEMSYQFQLDKYVAKDLTIVSEHILRQGGSALHLALQKEPNNVVWFVLADGSLAAFTYESEQEVYAWQRHSLGGNGVVESICASVAGTEDAVYFIVKRTINGATVRTIEKLDVFFNPTSTTDTSAQYFVDCGATYSGAPTTTISGLTWLYNETVSVVADGVYIGEKVVSDSGVVTLSQPASVVSIGYKYTGIIQLMPLDGGSREGGSSIGKAKRVGRTLLRVVSSRDFKYGSTLAALDKHIMKDATGYVATPLLVTDDIVVNMPMGYDLKATPFIVQDTPQALNVLAVGPDIEVGQ